MAVFPSNETLNDGTITSIDFSQPNERFLKVHVNDYFYQMRYDAVFLYADSEHPHYDRNSLPQRPVLNSEGEDFRFLCRPIRAVIKIHTIYMRTDPDNWTYLEYRAEGW